ncbi:NAD-dependent protein deacetylase [Pleurotus pulmonarius]
MFKFKRGRKERTPKVLDGLDAPALARYITSGKCKNITLMLGAGVSTSAGIPDFRSPETGQIIRANLARLNLPYPEAVFEINFFRRNPTPFYTLAQELYPGKFRPTITHSFIKLLATKSLLHTCFTQNIDTLERRAGIPAHKIIEAHGSFAKQRCIRCKIEFDDDMMKEHVLLGKVPKCETCGGYVKPDIVFFGEDLPPEFISAIPRLADADLLIVLGTSLTVHPFASLAGMVAKDCPRVLINLERVGDFGSRTDDVVLLGKCDEVVRDLAKALGWEEELERAWEETAQSVQPNPAKAIKPAEDQLDVDQLASEIGKALNIDDTVVDESKPQDSDKEDKQEGRKSGEAGVTLELPPTNKTVDVSKPTEDPTTK